ncbi:MAG TPA: winged helix-turn-helix domain-containing protein [Terriglobales bacterium]|nr:winged helix-turn-helix domain-containing protein [Terriglobales bacterium]
MQQKAKCFYEFGPFRLDPVEHVLLTAGTRVALTPKAFETLLVLVENAGHILEKDDLLKQVWPDTFVEEGTLARNISTLRKALGDDPEGETYVETVPRRGYCFVAEVREVAAAPSDGSVSPVAMPGKQPAPKVGEGHRVPEPVSPWNRFRRLAFAAVLVILAVVLILIIPVWKRHLAPGPAPIQSLAVLPLQNLSGDPAQQYFADGMTEALITDVAKIPGLKVISRTSIMQFKDTHERLPQITRELGVDGIVEGSVLRSGDRVRITVQLVRGTTDQHIWAESYERDLRDLITLQDEVSRSIALQIQKQIAPPSPQWLAASAVVSPQAREDYLKGRYFWNLRSEAGYRKAIDYFQAAVYEDPQYAQAYAGLADAYALLGSLPESNIRAAAMPKAKEMGLTALKLDDSLAEAHTSLAFVEMHYEWKFREAEQEFRRALDLNPNYSTAHQWYAIDLAALGQMGEAVEEVKLARQTDPLSAIINTDLAEMLGLARRYDEAVQQARATIDMAPNFAHAHRVLALIYAARHMFPEAIAEGKQAASLSGDDPWMLSDLANVYAQAGKKTEMQDCLRRAAKNSPGGVLPDSGSLAGLYAVLGDYDRAFKVMETQYKRRDGALILLNTTPPEAGIRSDPRFQQLLQRIGLPN